MRLSADLKAAINTYYAFQRTPCYRGSVNNTSVSSYGWPDDETKTRVCTKLCDVAARHGMHCTILPGTIILTRGNLRREITGPQML